MQCRVIQQEYNEEYNEQLPGRDAVKTAVSLEPYRFQGLYVGDHFSE